MKKTIGISFVLGIIIAFMTLGSVFAAEEAFSAVKPGDTGDQVKEVQELLSKQVYTQLEIDGSYGEATEQAVKDFQKTAGLSITGIVDRETYNKLKEEKKPSTYTLTANLWVRDQPSMNGSQIGKRDVLQQVEVYGFENGWAKINYENKTGYVYGKYIRQGVIRERQTTAYTALKDASVLDQPNGNVINTGTIYGAVYANEQVDVYEIESNGWARIKFPYYPAYVRAEYLRKGAPASSNNAQTAGSNQQQNAGTNQQQNAGANQQQNAGANQQQNAGTNQQQNAGTNQQQNAGTNQQQNPEANAGQDQQAYPEADTEGPLVYWVEDGDVYHYSIECPSLQNSDEIYSGSIWQSGKDRACEICS